MTPYAPVFQRPLGDKDTPDILDSGHPEDPNECNLEFPGGHRLRGYYVHMGGKRGLIEPIACVDL